MERTLCLIFIFLFALLITKLPAHIVPTDLEPSASIIFSATHDLKTESSFESEEFSTTEILPCKARYELDGNLPCGQEEIQQEGKEGKIIRHYRRIIWHGEYLEDELLSTDYQPATEEIIALGIKPGETFYKGKHRYNCVLKNFWATSYDGKCAGCSGRTHFTNEPVDHGICAVDPDIILPHSHFFVPGYGRCKAADKGGNLNAKHIDLGFDDVKNGWWHASYTDIYLWR